MIKFHSTGKERLNEIKTLWEKLRDHHFRHSLKFKEYYKKRTFKERANELLEKARDVKVDIATDAETEKAVGYCVTTISAEGVGEIDSLFVEDDQRGKNIGDDLMKRALAWLKENNITKTSIVVASGNENVITFYKRFGFYPKNIILQNNADS